MLHSTPFLVLCLVAAACAAPDAPRGDRAPRASTDTSTEGGPSRIDGDETAPVVRGPAAERMDAWLTALGEAGFSGVAAVRTPEGLILAKGYGLADDSTGVPVRRGTVFGTGSITKQFTAAAILMLEEESRLSVDDRISDYFEDVPDDKAEITLHHLLTHTAGFPGAIGDDYEGIGREEYVRRALDAGLEREPGSSYGYSNVGYSLLAAIVEQVSGQSYEVFLRDALFDPAGMRHTGYVLPDWSGRELAVGYRAGRRWGRLNERPWADDGPYWNLRGNGGILSTADDMIRWDQALRDGRVLSPASLDEMHTPHVLEYEDGDSYYGYGWALFSTPRDTRLAAHNGSNGIFFADFLRYLDEDVTVFVATNRATRRAGDLAWDLARVVFDPEAELPEAGWGSETIEDFPDTEAGATARALVALLTEGSPDELAPFIQSRFMPGFLEMVPLERHVEIMGQIQADLSGRTVTRIARDGNRFEVTLTHPDREPLMLSFGIAPNDPTRLGGLGVDSM